MIKPLKSLALVFLFATLPVFSSCDTQEKNEPKPPVLQTRFYPLQKQTSDPNVWNTEDVDVSHVKTNKKLIAFTFDDSPSQFSENIATIFASFNAENPDCTASATVFFNGDKLNAYANDPLELFATVGFEFGNHTYHHHDLTTLSAEQIRSEIDGVDRILQAVDKKERHLLRPPYGRVNDSVRQAAYTPIVDWTIDTLDWTGNSAETIYDTVFSQKFSGAIVLMHDGYEHTLTALKRLLPDLKKEGYQVLSVSQMAKAHNCALKRGGVYIRARKQG